MSRIKFHDDGEEHNFWQNYTDLMSGFLIVFIIASIVAYNQYNEKESLMSQLVEMAGGSKTGKLSDLDKERLVKLVSNAELYEKVSAFDKAQESLNSQYFHFDSLYRRFECKLDVQFVSDSSTIDSKYLKQLVQAGNEFVDIFNSYLIVVSIDFISYFNFFYINNVLFLFRFFCFLFQLVSVFTKIQNFCNRRCLVCTNYNQIQIGFFCHL